MFDFRKELNGTLNEPLFLGLLLRGYYTTLHYPQNVGGFPMEIETKISITHAHYVQIVAIAQLFLISYGIRIA